MMPRLEKDFYNRLLSRGPRFRMDAEMIRDQALAVSGLLNPAVGGPSVYPVQVAESVEGIRLPRPEIGMDEWPVSEGPDLYRRGVYTFWRRVCTYPTFATFDAPSRDVCVSRRPRTNTPLAGAGGFERTDPAGSRAGVGPAHPARGRHGSMPPGSITPFALPGPAAHQAERQRLVQAFTGATVEELSSAMPNRRRTVDPGRGAAERPAVWMSANWRPG